MRSNKNTTKRIYTPLFAAAVFTLSFLSPLMLDTPVSAANPFTEAFVRLDNLDATSYTSGRVCAKTTASDPGTESTVKVTFPVTSGTSYVVSSTLANWAVSTSNLDTGQTAWPGIATATAVSGNTVTFPSGALSSNTLYCFNWTNNTAALKTSSVGATETTQGNVATYTSGATVINQTTYSESIISNDQIVVNAVVPPSFAFALSGNTDSFTSNLTPATVVSTTGRTITVTTNAASGWIVWAEDLNNNGSGAGSLKSVTANHYIADVDGNAPGTAASAVLNISQENYGLGATINTNASGTVTINSAYDGTGSKAGSLDPVAYLPVASATSPANGDIISVNERANSTATTPEASDYSDTITFTGAGEF